MQKYRPDIDGLRAIAVLSVFAFHLSPSKFPAGGIGVDIFFVISGFLIGGILLRETAEESFSLARFYERRVRRIAPALLAAIAIWTAVGAALLLPNDFLTLAEATIAAVLSGSNIYFWQTADYFDRSSASIAALHTWSLGVEEQFYIVAPFVIMAIARTSLTTKRLVLVLLTVLSLAVSVHQVANAPSAAFYLPQSRAWELLIGVLLNVFPLSFAHARPRREIVAWLGAGGLAVSFVLVRPAHGFPGFAALLPCVSAAMVLAAGSEGATSLGRLLSWRPVVFMGLISYSFYLWHWPVIVFVHEYLTAQTTSAKAAFAIVVLTFTGSVLSWRFVERPFRSKHIGRRMVFLLAGAAAMLMIGVNAFVVARSGFPERLPPAAMRLAEFGSRYVEHGPKDDPCFIDTGVGGTLPASCLQPSTGRGSVLLLGDSHALMYRTALGRMLDLDVLEAAGSGCWVERAALGQGGTSCTTVLSAAVEAAPRIEGLLAIILSSRWANLDPASMTALLKQLRSIAPVYVLGPVPEYDVAVPKLMALAALRNTPDLPGKHLKSNYLKIDQSLARVTAASGAAYLSPAGMMCAEKQCLTIVGGLPAYFDDNHLTDGGARFVLERLLAPTPLRSHLRQVQ